MKKRILGGKSNSCCNCGETMIYIYIQGLGVVSQCRKCGNMVNGRMKDEIRIFSFNEKGDLI